VLLGPTLMTSLGYITHRGESHVRTALPHVHLHPRIPANNDREPALLLIVIEDAKSLSTQLHGRMRDRA